jgi:hypothetical protein
MADERTVEVPENLVHEIRAGLIMRLHDLERRIHAYHPDDPLRELLVVRRNEIEAFLKTIPQ